MRLSLPIPSNRASGAARACRGIALAALIILAQIGIAGAGAAQTLTLGGQSPFASNSPIQVDLVADTRGVEAGKPFRAGVRFRMEPSWHIYYHEPGEVGLPTRIEWRLPEGFEAGPLQWPAPEDFNDSGLKSRGYTPEVLLFATITPPAELTAEQSIVLKVNASWLVCKADGQCIPGKKELALALPAAPTAPSDIAALFDETAKRVKDEDMGSGNVAAPSPTTPAPTPSPSPAPTPAPTPNPEIESAPSGAAPIFSFLSEAQIAKPRRSFLEYLLFAFLGGLILNVMPCVLPVVSIKILGFVRQAHDEPRRIFMLGLVYAAGVLVSFAAMATLVVVIQQVFKHAIGWGFFFAEPRFLIAMTAVLFVFGLSLFGVFEIDLPWAVAQAGGNLQRREGAAGAFFSGVLATALATPCAAPFLGSALGFAFLQPAPIVYLFFLTIGAGLAAPYVLLAAQPKWLKFIPKPGNWMIVFKQVMGFFLMATAVYLLSLLGGLAGAEGVVNTLILLVALGVGAWLLGLPFYQRAKAGARWGVWVAVLALAAAAYGYFPEAYLQRIKNVQASPVEAATAQPAPAEGAEAGRIAWTPFTVARVEELAKQNRVIFVDFTADWCLTCKVNEAGALSSASVREAFGRHNVAALKADYTSQPPELTRILRAFGRAGVPMYLVFPAGSPEKAFVLSEALTPGMVVDAINRAANSGGAETVARGN